MQETKFGSGIHQEYFVGETDQEVKEKMDARLKKLEELGHELSKRVKIGRNELCPCGSGLKFKKCCFKEAK